MKALWGIAFFFENLWIRETMLWTGQINQWHSSPHFNCKTWHGTWNRAFVWLWWQIQKKQRCLSLAGKMKKKMLVEEKKPNYVFDAGHQETAFILENKPYPF